jgi:hypothetical protein
MATSITTMSGDKVPASCTARRPPSASPTTSRSLSLSRIERRDRVGNAGNDAAAPAVRARPDDQGTAELVDPLTERREPEAASPGIAREADPVVFDRDLQGGVFAPDPDASLGDARVLARVHQELADRAEDRDPRGLVRDDLLLGRDLHRKVVAALQVLGEPSGGRDESDVVEKGRAQLEGQGGELAAHFREDPRHLLDVDAPLAPHRVGERPELDRRQREELTRFVVEIGRQLAALPFLRERCLGRRPSQCPFGGAQLRHVEERNAERLAALGTSRADDLQVELVPILEADREIEALPRGALDECPSREVPPVLVPFGDEARKGPPDQSGERDLEEPGGEAIGPHDHAFGVEREESDGCRLVQPAVAVLGLLRGELGRYELLVLDLQLDLVDLQLVDDATDPVRGQIFVGETRRAGQSGLGELSERARASRLASFHAHSSAASARAAGTTWPASWMPSRIREGGSSPWETGRPLKTMRLRPRLGTS